MNTSYDVIIGHSLGGAVALSLLPFLPKGKETTIVLVDPALEVPDEQLAENKKLFLKEVASPRTPDEHMAENPAWSRSDCMLRTLGLSMCDRTTVRSLFEVNLQAYKLQGLLTSPTFLITRITRHGLSLACSKTSPQT
jgi:hypothetical protein